MIRYGFLKFFVELVHISLAQMLGFSLLERSIVPATTTSEERIKAIPKVSETKTCPGFGDDTFPAST
tara:strand:+ start:320 stop:520 length:201 start_codon:yes stop_codon:yes gene_type:complete